MSSTLYLTKERFLAYQKELDFLETSGKGRMAKFLGEATGSGIGRPAFGPAAELDRDYMQRIMELKTKLNIAHIIEDGWEQIDTSEVFIGATVTLRDLDTGEKIHYTIVGSDDVNVEQGLISYLSPVGSALLKRTVGDVIEVNIRQGLRFRYRIEDCQKLPIEVEIPESSVLRAIRRLE